MIYRWNTANLVKSAWKILLGFVLVGMFTAHATANTTTPTPRIKPTVPHTSALLTKHDANNFRQGMRAADQRKWDNVERYKRRISDPTAQNILDWRQAVDDPYVSMKLLTKVAQTQSDWPRMTRIRAKAEIHLFDRPLSPRKTISWFQGAEPISGEGRAALARAYYKQGQNDIADRWLRSAWRDAKLTRDRQRTLYRRYKHRLTPEDHAARADHLIWLGRRYYGSAGGLSSMMNASDRALMDARMRVGANRKGMDKAVKSVPAILQGDTGLLFERARWRRIKRTEVSALEPLLKITTPARTQQGKNRVWIEKKRMIYWALPKKRYQDAYDLTLHHGLTSGANFADAEFLAGWLALTKLNKPKLALEHFTTLKNGVSLPVSTGRASYWMGRAAEAMGGQNARAYYADAAKYPNVYYGQLASERINQGFAFIDLPAENIGASDGADFDSRELVRALHMLGEIQAERSFNQFSFHLDDILEQAHELTQLSQLGKKYGYMKPSVRAAKQAGRLDTMLTESGYPKPDVIIGLSSNFDIPFVLAIARQESEFNTKARSHASAHGLMQMINATAKATARKARLPYQQAWLTDDPEYAAKLGSHHINDLLVEFDGSYIMAAAAYNAGGGRVRKWNKAYGDPRRGQIDPIDWIESIPFSETRNYVQRVMENMEVYRARLNNNQTQLQLVHNMTNGAYR